MREQVEEILKDVAKALKRDGGDIELVDIEDNVVKVRLKGSCAGCPFSQMTIKNFVEKELRNAIPEIEKVEAVPVKL
ncbi:DUF59 domain-containing protein [Candidatus Poribacteria bacterium]|nr:DUF59 domain-containing protein [Candidatus Poribacteria bacterium]